TSDVVDDALGELGTALQALRRTLVRDGPLEEQARAAASRDGNHGKRRRCGTEPTSNREHVHSLPSLATPAVRRCSYRGGSPARCCRLRNATDAARREGAGGTVSLAPR